MMMHISRCKLFTNIKWIVETDKGNLKLCRQVLIILLKQNILFHQNMYITHPKTALPHV